MTARKNLFITLLTLICLINFYLPPAVAQGDYDGGGSDGAVTQKLDTACFVTWWFHSALGYHPAILMRVENASGQSLPGVILKFQARFTNLRDGYVNVAREEIRASLEPKKQLYVFLKGPRAFELPIDQSLWPRMECKVMCRVSDGVTDGGTQTMLITKLDSITMSFEDAMTNLAKQPDIRIGRRKPTPTPVPARPEKTLVATTGSLAVKDNKPKQTLLQFLGSTFIPGLGDDFYSFEKKFGIPAEFDPKAEWTWARYQSQSPELSMIVGSRGQTGKADLIVATVPPSQIKGEGQVTELAKAISGKFRSETTTPPNHSVRYLPSGRLEFGTLSAKNYRAVYFVPGESGGGNGSYIVVVTRMPGNVLEILRKEAPRAKLLKFLQPITGVSET
ncbi:hypothetical protein KF707_08805 [Candidatus Obscuribacterales bacterium]|nr:hypothetical protein [Candidatus Obscuribacterales bacterium]MBX3136325.1 hypothetical protein [Candidatus Obscuribacterales bacterium]MBX3148789.1 hypothetical protein [Candidatus Obscuribacterales bacterium]